MVPAFLVPETTVHANGDGAALELTAPKPEALLITEGITSVIEQEFLSITIEGSPDGTAWTPLATFPQKFYAGLAAMVVDLKEHPDTAYLRAHWKVGRWGRGDKTPCFRFYVFAEPLA